MKKDSKRWERWSATDLEYLKNNFPILNNEEIVKHLQRTVFSIIGKARGIGVYKTENYSPMAVRKRWTEEDKSLLERLHKEGKNIKEIAVLMDRTEISIKSEKNELGLLSEAIWSKQEIEILTKMYPENSNRYIASCMKKSKSCIAAKAQRIGLKKIDKSTNKDKEPSILWSKEEIDILKKYYPDNSVNYIMTLLPNRKSKNIVAKARKLKILKAAKIWSIQDEQKLIDLDKKKKLKELNPKKSNNKKRNLTFEVVKKIAFEYKSKAEFRDKDSTAYSVAQKNNWLIKICGHMISFSSRPQLILNNYLLQLFPNIKIDYNNRQVIKPLEIDIWIPEFKLAFEYDGKYWHRNDDNSKKRKICEDLGITIFFIKEETTKYEQEIKRQIIENLEAINTVAKSNIGEEQILKLNVSENCFDGILDLKGIKEICDKYTILEDFREDCGNLYDKITKIGKIQELTGHMKRHRINGFWAIPGNIENVVKKYKKLSEFMKNDKNCYTYIIRHKEKLPLIAHLETTKKHKEDRNKSGYWENADNIIKTIKKYSSLKDFRENERYCYDIIINKHREYLPLLSVLEKKINQFG